jgi:hypothetical protein
MQGWRRETSYYICISPSGAVDKRKGQWRDEGGGWTRKHLVIAFRAKLRRSVDAPN